MKRRIILEGPFTHEQVTAVIEFVRLCDELAPEGRFIAMLDTDVDTVDEMEAAIRRGLPETSGRVTRIDPNKRH